MSIMNVQKVKVNSSNEHFNNLNDEKRVYSMEANANIRDGVMDSMDSGNVFKNGEQVANFNSWKNGRLNITYQGVSLEERNEINVAVDGFINEVKNAING